MKGLKVENLTVDVPGRRLFAGLDLVVAAGECVAVKGPSGAGKTTLLNCIAGIFPATSGSVIIDGQALSDLSTSQRSDFRLRNIGMVFQFGELLPELTMLENVALPLRLTGVSRQAAEERAAGWLARLKLTKRANTRPEQISGGEIQRAGIARALVHDPKLVLADEPTGMLDEQNTKRVIDLLVRLAKEQDVTVILVTHDPLAASAADRVLNIKGSRLAEDAHVQIEGEPLRC